METSQWKNRIILNDTHFNVQIFSNNKKPTNYVNLFVGCVIHVLVTNYTKRIVNMFRPQTTI